MVRPLLTWLLMATMLLAGCMDGMPSVANPCGASTSPDCLTPPSGETMWEFEEPGPEFSFVVQSDMEAPRDCRLRANFTRGPNQEVDFLLLREVEDGNMYGLFSHKSQLIQVHAGPIDSRTITSTPTAGGAVNISVFLDWENVTRETKLWVILLGLSGSGSPQAAPVTISLACSGPIQPAARVGSEAALVLLQSPGGVGASLKTAVGASAEVGSEIVRRFEASSVSLRVVSRVTSIWEIGMLSLKAPGYDRQWVLNTNNSIRYDGLAGEYRIGISDVRGHGYFFGFLAGTNPVDLK